jgi:hypothetical protein
MPLGGCVVGGGVMGVVGIVGMVGVRVRGCATVRWWRWGGGGGCGWCWGGCGCGRLVVDWMRGGGGRRGCPR